MRLVLGVGFGDFVGHGDVDVDCACVDPFHVGLESSGFDLGQLGSDHHLYECCAGGKQLGSTSTLGKSILGGS
jgi:hypothetical protein